MVGACKWFAPESGRQGTKAKSTRGAERREIASRYLRVIEDAGGNGVWVKGRCGASGVRDPLEVVAVPWAFEAVLSALEKQSKQDSLRTRVRELRSPQGLSAVEVSILEGQDTLARWRLRQVPRLLRAAIIIDDLGEDLQAARNLLELPCPLTLAVLPGLPHSVETAEEAQRAHREVMLHLPMEAEPGTRLSPGAGAIRVGMSSGEVARVIQADLDSVPYARGVNNHMGSRATADPALMSEVMRVLGERRLYFVDSRTTADTVALDAARAAGLPTFYRSVFLDDTETVGYTLGQLRRFRRLVQEQGAGLAIGHPHPTTLGALARFLPELERDDIELVPASQLVHLPEVARLSPPGRKQPAAGSEGSPK